MSKTSQYMLSTATVSSILLLLTIFFKSTLFGFFFCFSLWIPIAFYLWKIIKKENIIDFIVPFFQILLLINLSISTSYILAVLYLQNFKDFFQYFHLGIQYSLGISYFIFVITLSNIFYLNTIKVRAFIWLSNFIAVIIAIMIFHMNFQALATMVILTSVLMTYFSFIGFLLTYNKLLSTLAILINVEAVIYSYIYFNKHKELIFNTLSTFY